MKRKKELKNHVTEFSQELSGIKNSLIEETTNRSKVEKMIFDKVESLEKENVELKHELKIVKNFQKKLDYIVNNIDELQELIKLGREVKQEKDLADFREAEQRELENR